MKSGSLIIRIKNRLSHQILPNVDCDDLSCEDDYGIGDVIRDCYVAFFVGLFIIVLPCSVFNWPIYIFAGALIIPAILLTDYIKQKGISRFDRILAALLLISTIYFAISLMASRWDWYVGFF